MKIKDVARRKLVAWFLPCAIVSSGICSRADAEGAELRVENAIELSRFGGRPAFSPDGKRIAFVGRTYGDAYEIDVATQQVRNLTKDIPNNGIVRIQYLRDGNFLVTAPRASAGPNTRAHLEMWVLDKSLKRGLQPLGSQVFEGTAVSRKTNTIAWSVIEPELGARENWQLGFSRPIKHYMADVAYRQGRAFLNNKREILSRAPKECAFIEPQDFRDGDAELIYSCMGSPVGGAVSISVWGTQLPDGASTTYFKRGGTYAEVEGIAPDGRWAAVECGEQAKAVLPPLDLCRLQLQQNGSLTPLVKGTMPQSTWGISNPVISPDGRWIAFQRSNSADADIGGGSGVYLAKLPVSQR
jgi:hypothetical protein